MSENNKIKEKPCLTQKSLLNTLLLATFLAGLGVHNFYIGKKIKGILSLLFSITIVPYILSIIDIIIMSTLSIEKLNARYNQVFEDFEKSTKFVFLVIAILDIIALIATVIFVVAVLFFGMFSSIFERI